tara:strand:+ start:443 stop:1753 length:1311 start_codon:yes stop_codon:yes gene_type:complete
MFNSVLKLNLDVPQIKDLFNKIGIITLVDVATKVSAFIILPFYLGLMPKEEFAEFTFIQAALIPLTLTISLSLYVPFINFLTNNKNTFNSQDIINSVINFLFIWLLILLILFIFLKPLLISELGKFFSIDSYLSLKYYIIFFLVITNTFSLYLYALVISRKKNYETVIFLLLKFIFANLFSLIFIYFEINGSDTSLNRFSGILFGELILIGIFYFYMINNYISLRLNWIIISKLFKTAIPLIPSGIIGLCMVLIDRKYILNYHGSEDLADYNLAMIILMPIQMLMASVQTIWAPYLFSIDTTVKSYKNTFNMSLFYLIISIFAVLASFILFKTVLYFGIIDSVYFNVPQIILFLGLGVSFMTVLQLFVNLFVRLEKTEFHLIISLIILVIFFLLNNVLVPSLSGVGAAIALTISYFVGFALSVLILFYLYQKEIKE